jgi:hypothetical protein
MMKRRQKIDCDAASSQPPLVKRDVVSQPSCPDRSVETSQGTRNIERLLGLD